MDRILPTYPADRSASAQRQLERLGVTVRTTTRVMDDRRRHGPRRGGRRDGSGGRSGPGPCSGRPGCRRRRSGGRWRRRWAPRRTSAGRIRVGPDLTDPRPPRDPRDRRRGDAAVDARPAGAGRGAGRDPGRQVRRAGRSSRGSTGEPAQPFRYQDRGDVAVIGRLRGVTNIGWLGPFGRQGGFLAWALWLGIHIVYLIGFANRIVVSMRWAWSFLTRGRSTRLITGTPQVLPIAEPAPPHACRSRGPTRRSRGAALTVPRRVGRGAPRHVDRHLAPRSRSIRSNVAPHATRGSMSRVRTVLCCRSWRLAPRSR